MYSTLVHFGDALCAPPPLPIFAFLAPLLSHRTHTLGRARHAVAIRLGSLPASIRTTPPRYPQRRYLQHLRVCSVHQFSFFCVAGRSLPHGFRHILFDASCVKREEQRRPLLRLYRAGDRQAWRSRTADDISISELSSRHTPARNFFTTTPAATDTSPARTAHRAHRLARCLRATSLLPHITLLLHPALRQLLHTPPLQHTRPAPAPACLFPHHCTHYTPYTPLRALNTAAYARVHLRPGVA